MGAADRAGVRRDVSRNTFADVRASMTDDDDPARLEDISCHNSMGPSGSDSDSSFDFMTDDDDPARLENVSCHNAEPDADGEPCDFITKSLPSSSSLHERLVALEDNNPKFRLTKQAEKCLEDA